MSGPVVLYSVVFVLYSVMEVLGLMPQEVRSAGITLPALFANYYGDQVLHVYIVHVHICIPYCIYLYHVKVHVNLKFMAKT